MDRSRCFNHNRRYLSYGECWYCSATSPLYCPLDIKTNQVGGRGIRIVHTNVPYPAGGGEATIRLDAISPGGKEYGIHSIGSGWGAASLSGAFMIRDETTPATPRFIIASGGEIGIGTTTPVEKLSVSTAGSNDGISVTQTGTDASALHLYNLSSGGNHWALFSTGSGNTQHAGHFSIFQYGGGDRLLIDGTSGNVGIGLNTAPVNARLDVKQQGGATFNRGIYSDATNTTWTSGTQGATFGENRGIHGIAGAPAFPLQLSTNIGVYGEGYEGTAMGGFFYGSSAGGGNAYGVYARALNTGGGATWAGYFDGSTRANGGVYSYNVLLTSDKKLKKNIQPLNDGLSKIMLLKPSTYSFKTDEFKNMNLPAEKQIGLIAQELAEVFPELVGNVAASQLYDPQGKTDNIIPEHKVVNYIGLIPVLISGIQEQQKLIEEQTKANEAQQKQLEEQQRVIEELTKKVSGTTGIGDINSVETGFRMSQNEPNPFTHETVVKYTLPQSVSNVFMAVYDLTGKQITTFPISEKGSSAITITSEKLAAGIYIYSIVADGKIMDSKRMVVSEK